MSTSIFLKDPDAVLDYDVDWTTWLDGDTISTASWVVPAGITQASASNTTAVAKIWLSGGTSGEDYDVVSRIVTAAGRTDDRTIKIMVRPR